MENNTEGEWSVLISSQLTLLSTNAIKPHIFGTWRSRPPVCLLDHGDGHVVNVTISGSMKNSSVESIVGMLLVWFCSGRFGGVPFGGGR